MAPLLSDPKGFRRKCLGRILFSQTLEVDETKVFLSSQAPSRPGEEQTLASLTFLYRNPSGASKTLPGSDADSATGPGGCCGRRGHGATPGGAGGGGGPGGGGAAADSGRLAARRSSMCSRSVVVTVAPGRALLLLHLLLGVGPGISDSHASKFDADYPLLAARCKSSCLLRLARPPAPPPQCRSAHATAIVWQWLLIAKCNPNGLRADMKLINKAIDMEGTGSKERSYGLK
ncbi:unnamed protein product [Bemisia tabaci]|uniref:Uncharacterized protein n=1 Tax=Bemisia tabaci TaxID=7038 RepID=A0A9P0A3K5_BEMTA|nr:unnamed protein product [Bemisia tabaci]